MNIDHMGLHVNGFELQVADLDARQATAINTLKEHHAAGLSQMTVRLDTTAAELHAKTADEVELSMRTLEDKIDREVCQLTFSRACSFRNSLCCVCGMLA